MNNDFVVFVYQANRLVQMTVITTTWEVNNRPTVSTGASWGRYIYIDKNKTGCRKKYRCGVKLVNQWSDTCHKVNPILSPSPPCGLRVLVVSSLEDIWPGEHPRFEFEMDMRGKIAPMRMRIVTWGAADWGFDGVVDSLTLYSEFGITC